MVVAGAVAVVADLVVVKYGVAGVVEWWVECLKEKSNRAGNAAGKLCNQIEQRAATRERPWVLRDGMRERDRVLGEYGVAVGCWLWMLGAAGEG